ncbi:MAG: hypothetical protein JOZ77_05310 [Candidatus Eremiobacteraeota bacterium]|nr:hypothetical protein [Candidatus Eremiobacteraeota bacterium]
MTKLVAILGFPLLALVATAAPVCAQAPSNAIAWSPYFDKIRDPALKRKLLDYKNEGWTHVFTLVGKGVGTDELVREAKARAAMLQARIARDGELLQGVPATGAPANADACVDPSGRALKLACDAFEQTDQLNAVNGVLQILRSMPSLPAPAEADFGFAKGALIGTTTVTVRPKRTDSNLQLPAIARSARPASVTPHTKAITLLVGQTISVDSQLSGYDNLVGFSVKPTAVLQAITGRIHVLNGRFVYLRAVAAGIATISYYQPPVGRTVRQAACGGGTSSRWSGYILGGGPFTGITGSWVVPTIAANSNEGMSSSWIGIDGCNESQLIQTGTEQETGTGFLDLGGTSYSAWWEILPASETSLSNPIFPGDVMVATIATAGQPASPNATSNWILTLNDITQNWTATSQAQPYFGLLDEAEWIEEAPTICTPGGCGEAALADYQTVTFDSNGATANNTVTIANGSATTASLNPAGIILMNSGGNDFSTPSSPDCDGDGFTAIPGFIAPAPPGPNFAATSLPAGVVGMPYNQTLQILGAASASFAPTMGTVTPGTSFNNGTVSGTPTSTGSFTFGPLVATDTTQTTRTCTATLSMSVSQSPAPATPTPATFSAIRITILTGNDDLRSDSDLQINFTGIGGWPGATCLVQGNSGRPVGGSACTSGSPGDWATGPVNNWNGWAAWNTQVETKSFPTGLQFSGSGTVTLTFTTHNTGCGNLFGGCGSANDNWDIQALQVDLIGSPTLTLFSVGNFNSPHSSGTCFFRVKPPGGTDPASIAVSFSFPPAPNGNGCPSDS